MDRKSDYKMELSINHTQGTNAGESKQLALDPPAKSVKGNTSTSLMVFSHQKFTDAEIRLFLGVPRSLAELHNFSSWLLSIREVLAGKRTNAR